MRLRPPGVTPHDSGAHRDDGRGDRRGLDPYLLDQEVVVLRRRPHWMRLLPTFACVALAGILALGIDASAPKSGEWIATAAWWFFFGWVLRGGWVLIEWRDGAFVVTDRRLVLQTGVIAKRVAMMPFVKVTDMSMKQSLLGTAFGYGQLVFESAGQEQAMRNVEFVPDVKHTYRTILGQIFPQPFAPGSVGARHSARTGPIPVSESHPTGPITSWPDQSDD